MHKNISKLLYLLSFLLFIFIPSSFNFHLFSYKHTDLLTFFVQTAQFFILFLDLSTKSLSISSSLSHFTMVTHVDMCAKISNNSAFHLWHDSSAKYMLCSFPVPAQARDLIMYSFIFAVCRPRGSSLHICASSPVPHFSWHHKPVLLLLLVVLISTPLLHFPRGTSCCLTLSHRIPSSQNQTQPPAHRMHYILLCFTWDIFHAFFCCSSKPTDTLSAYDEDILNSQNMLWYVAAVLLS